MPGGWSMSMAWMRMPEQTWVGACASFVAMWTLMMVAMMLPSLVPMLLNYRRHLREHNEPHLAQMTWLAGAGYFFVWALLGAAVYPIGVSLSMAAMHSEELASRVPIIVGIVVILAGCFQVTSWKTGQLLRCRDLSDCGPLPASGRWGAWMQGIRMGQRCGICCIGLMVVLLVAGVMDVVVMGLITAAITAERLVNASGRVGRALGFAVILVGAVMTLRALSVV